ncbi:MAG: PQQ-binding-like beta-propeller repeat protein, partial [Verrucomicrobiota bacterium]
MSRPFLIPMQTLFRIPLVLLCLTQAIIAADWPHFQGPSRLGISEETGLNVSWGEDGPPLLWSLDLDEGFGGAAVVGDEVFFLDRELGETDVLFCVSLEDGSTLWKFAFEHAGRLPHHGSRGVPAVEEDAVYITSGFGHIHRVNRTTHSADWVVDVSTQYESSPPKWGWAQSPVIVGDVLVIAPMSPTVGLAGLDKETGKEIWRTEPFGDSHSTPTVLTLDGVEQVVFVGTSLRDAEEPIGTVLSVDPTSGELLWQTHEYYNKIPIPFPTKIDEERVYLTGGYECGSAMIRVKHQDQSWSVEKLWEIS